MKTENKRSMSRQERRHQERLEKKQGKKEYKMEWELFQPWSVPVMKTTLPPDVLQTMIEISDLIVADIDGAPFSSLPHSLPTELQYRLIEHNILEQTGVMEFFLGAVRQFVIQCKCNMMPGNEEVFQREEWLTQMTRMWIVSQQPNEYSPVHVHAQCQISAVMYLKVPKILPSKKEHRPIDDGYIHFVGNASRDIDLSVPLISFPPQVGDFYIFGAHQQHGVYPYRCAEGQKDTERRSVSFNTIFQSKADFDREQKYLQNETKK
jgi:hypothetical protein